MKSFGALKHRPIRVLLLASLSLWLFQEGLILVQNAREAARRRECRNLGGDPEKDMKTLLGMRAKFPIVPLSDRLQYEATFEPAGEAPTLSAESERLLKQFEQKVLEDRRRWALSQLHDQSYEKFVAKVGFGRGRMWNPLEWKTVLIPEPPLVSLPKRLLLSRSNPETPLSLTQSDDSVSAQIKEFNAAWNLHANRYFDFVNPTRLGAVALAEKLPSADASTSRSESTTFTASRSEPIGSDRRRQGPLSVGFISHAMSFDAEDSLQEQTVEWNILSLELVSMLKFPEPRVYVSTHMPNMEELKSAKSRPLDAFEQQAIKQLHEGEEIVVDSKENQIRMVGAVRAAGQCLECHAARRGDLLGAFSYSLDCIPPAENGLSVTQIRQSQLRNSISDRHR